MKKAPDFTLKDTNNEDVTLSDYQDKKNVVLLFFPFAFSGVCTKELCSARDNLKIYEALGAEVIGISIDSFYTLRAYKEAHNLNFLLLSDFNKEVSKKYDVLYDNYFGLKGVSKRSVFVIDKQGRIVHSEILEDSGKIPDFNKVQEILSGLNN